MPDYTPYNVQDFFQSRRPLKEYQTVQDLQSLQQFASIPAVQEKMAKLLGTNAGLRVMPDGGVDAATLAAMQHEERLNPDRNAAFQLLYPESQSLTNFYSNVANPATRAFDERQRLIEQMQRLFGMTQLPGPNAYMAPQFQ